VTVAVISASVDWTPLETPMAQALPGGEVRFHAFTNLNLPPRPVALHPRMVAKVPKVFGWQMVPEADAYIWLDASLTFRHAGAVAWFLEQLGDADIAIFKHPFRKTVLEEAEYLRKQTPFSRRLMQRYLGEWIPEQMAAIAEGPDDRLFAAGAFIYRVSERFHQAMQIWWEHMTRYCINDQISLPFALWSRSISVHVINLNIFNNQQLRAAR
jgi:hypothetical protein